jgi:hypothetical protein
MSKHETYRHEDIEALLMSKTFDELLAEERSFVMQHVQSEEEYNSLRRLLLEMHELSFDDELHDAPESLETALMHGFAEHAEKERGYKRRFAPWMGWAAAAAILACSLIFFWPEAPTVEMAEVDQNEHSPSNSEQTPAIESPKQEESRPAAQGATITMPSEVENLLAQVVPATTPSAPSFATGLYEYEDALDAVSLTAEENDSPSSNEYAPVELDFSETQIGQSVQEDVAMSAVPDSPPAQMTESLSAKDVKTIEKINAETKAQGKANRKKTRNPEVMKLSQSRKLKSLLRND